MKLIRTAITGALLLLAGFANTLSAAPRFTNAIIQGGNLVLQGSGGINYGPYNLLSSTNLALPQSKWLLAANGNFSSNGLFALTNAANLSLGRQFYALQPLSSSNSLWIPACGAWLGAEVTNGASQDFTAESTRIGRPLDILRIYHGVGSWTGLTSEEKTYIAAGQKLLISFKPASPWSNAGGSNVTVNAALKTLAQSVAGVAPANLMVCIWHEPENNVTTNGGSDGTTGDYVSMWTNVQHIFRANGATNVIWDWIIMNYSKYWGSLPGLWPGNTNVDWIGWDAYQETNTQNYVSAQTTAYNHMVSSSAAANNYLSKPWAWTEWGVGINGWYPTVADQTNTFNAVNGAVNSNQFPKVKYMSYFDISGSSAPNASSAILPGAQAAYNALANSAYLFQKAPPPNLPSLRAGRWSP
jgi:hypothetical protein